MSYKDKHRIAPGIEMRLMRNVDQFDNRIKNPVNGIVIDAENIHKGAEILLNHNATHDVHKLFEVKGSGTIFYFSIPLHDVYAWRINDEWEPIFPYDLALRIFKPYEGYFSAMPPTVVAQKLFLLTGKLKHKVVITRHHSDYEIIYQEKTGKEEKIIRVRTADSGYNKNQIYAIDHDATDKVFEGNLLIGTSPQFCKPFEVNAYAD